LKGFAPIQFEHLVGMENGPELLGEVDHILRLIFPDSDPEPLHKVYNDIVKLFEGQWPGYQKCNTEYHDLKHTLDCFLAMARLIHGGSLDGIEISEGKAHLGLVSALMHDTGYIQPVDDLNGTGAKYTLVHIDRSIGFLKNYFAQNAFSRKDFFFCRNCLKCTGLDVKIDQISFSSHEDEILGKMLGTADLLGQMASPTYLERLPVLFSEFIEARIRGIGDELRFVEQTIQFWETTQKRFMMDLGHVDALMQHHFRVRWGIDRNLYHDAIERHIRYLDYVLKHYRTNYHDYLSRDGWMKLAVHPCQ
jgi:hypothetical protein